MPTSAATANSKQFHLFCTGIAIVLLSLWFPYIPDWLTFIHTWRVELFASIILTIILAAIFFWTGNEDAFDFLSQEERFYIVYPILALVGWSLLSAFWAGSWKSAVHHALIWSEYLIFYCLVRNLTNSEDRQYGFVFVLAGVIALYAFPAVAGYVSLQVFGGTNTLGIRFSRFGEQAVVLLPILTVLSLTQWHRHKWIGIASIASSWLLVLSSMSRASIFLATAVTFSAALALVLRERSKINRMALGSVLIAFLLSPFLLHIPSLLSRNGDAPVAQRFSDSSGLSDSNGFRKLMVALSLEMIADKPLTGIGADNFGFQVHKYRETYAEKYPDDVLLAYAENEIPERAHNEYLQIAAELGIVGIAIFAWLLIGIALIARRAATRIYQIPPIALAAIIGIFGFLAAGLVTSYSFRLIQNGFFFFFALSIAAKYLLADEEIQRVPKASRSFPGRLLCVAGIGVSLMLSLYSVTRVASVIVHQRAGVIGNRQEANELYQWAAWLDSENPGARKGAGMRSFRDLDFEKAVPQLSRSVEMGESTSTSYSYLVSAQILAGDLAGAENTIRKAAAIYPKSVFVQSRFGSFLETVGKHDEAAKVFGKAYSIDPKVAATWRMLLSSGAIEVSSKAIDPASGLVHLMDLTPQSAVYAIMSERLIKHPEEQKFSMFKPHN